MARIPGTTFHDSDPPPKPPQSVAGPFPVSMVFEDGKMKPDSEWRRPGKPEWPHYLLVKMDRAQALYVIQKLATALQDPMQDHFEVSFAGEIMASE
jgi:hypothetical protein